MRVNQDILRMIDGIEDIRLDDLRPPVTPARQCSRLVVAGAIHMVDIDLQIADKGIEVGRLNNHLYPQSREFFHPRPARPQPTGEHLEPGPVEILAEDLDGLPRPSARRAPYIFS